MVKRLFKRESSLCRIIKTLKDNHSLIISICNPKYDAIQHGSRASEG